MSEIINQCETKQTSIGSIVDNSLLKENLKTNCIPENFYMMTIDDYDSFLKERRKLMAEKIKRYYYSL